MSNFEIRPALIHHFAKHSIKLGETILSHYLVNLSWYKHHPDKDVCGKPISVWENDVFETIGLHSIIPIQFIVSRAISLVENIHPYSPSVLLTIPCVGF